MHYPLKTLPGSALFAFTGEHLAVLLCRLRLRLFGDIGATYSGGALWWLSRSSSVYWAPSGEVYINIGGSRYDIIGFTEEDALGLLRFRCAGRKDVCEIYPCTLVTRDRLKVLMQAAGIDSKSPCKPERDTPRSTLGSVTSLVVLGRDPNLDMTCLADTESQDIVE